jgi:hypothetical protein
MELIIHTIAQVHLGSQGVDTRILGPPLLQKVIGSKEALPMLVDYQCHRPLLNPILTQKIDHLRFFVLIQQQLWGFFPKDPTAHLLNLAVVNKSTLVAALPLLLSAVVLQLNLADLPIHLLQIQLTLDPGKIWMTWTGMLTVPLAPPQRDFGGGFGL